MLEILGVSSWLTVDGSRNCTKHQVRCDYKDSELHEDRLNSVIPSVTSPTEVDAIISQWQRTGVASMGDLSIDLRDHASDDRSDDLQMVYHILHAGQTAESGKYTVWTDSFSQ